MPMIGEDPHRYPTSTMELPLHRRYFGDNRILLLSAGCALLQLMHPALGAGVQHFSALSGSGFEGVTQVMPAIQGVVFDWPDGAPAARQIRDTHRRISGLDSRGNRYHAWDPSTVYWGHATTFIMMVTAVDLFDHRLTEAEKDRLAGESREIYRRYGLADRDVPADWAAFEAYLDRMLTEVLELTPAARTFLGLENRPPEGLPVALRPLRRPIGRLMWWIGLGTAPPQVRVRIGRRWTAWDERRLRWLATAIRLGWPLLPRRLRLSRRSRAGIDRATQCSGR